MVKIVLPHQSPSFNEMFLVAPTTLSTLALIVLKVVCVGSGCSPDLYTISSLKKL
jgi:hypothetical protein